MNIVDGARQKHDQWSRWTPEEKARGGSSYCYGDKMQFPTPGMVLESHLRIELMEAIPRNIQFQCK
eukprot:11055319-Prorocentrum_lima.AAC.1